MPNNHVAQMVISDCTQMIISNYALKTVRNSVSKLKNNQVNSHATHVMFSDQSLGNCTHTNLKLN